VIKTAAALFSAGLILCATAFAQAPVQPQPNQGSGVATMETLGPDGKPTSVTVVHLPACPVAMTARQGGLTQMIKAGQKPPEPQQYDPMPRPSQQIHLILSGFGKDKTITSATVTARGLTSRGGVFRLSAIAASSLRRTMDVWFSPGEDGAVAADIDLPAFTSVSSLQLQSITYSDGSTWKVPDGRVCRVAPDPVMLIAGR
jgi:hypothetical protein